MLVVMIGIRKSLDCMFTHRELKILDDIMPEMTKRAAVEDMHNLEEGEVSRFARVWVLFFQFFMSCIFIRAVAYVAFYRVDGSESEHENVENCPAIARKIEINEKKA